MMISPFSISFSTFFLSQKSYAEGANKQRHKHLRRYSYKTRIDAIINLGTYLLLNFLPTVTYQPNYLPTIEAKASIDAIPKKHLRR